MSYFAGCRFKIELPSDRMPDEGALRRALLEKLPGIDIGFISDLDVRRPTVAEAFVPHGHPMAGMMRKDFGGTEMRQFPARPSLASRRGF